MDELHANGILFIYDLQHSTFGTWKFEDFWLVCTKLGDPAWIFIVYFPLLLAISRRKEAAQVLIAGCFSEFLNGVLKWF